MVAKLYHKKKVHQCGIIPSHFRDFAAGHSFRKGQLELTFDPAIHNSLKEAELAGDFKLPNAVISELRNFLETGKTGLKEITSGEHAGKMAGIELKGNTAQIITPYGTLSGQIKDHVFLRHDPAMNTDIFGTIIEFNKIK